jgi:hypothetical protein
MATERSGQSNLAQGEPESLFEIEFEASESQNKINDEEKQRIRQELMNLEW